MKNNSLYAITSELQSLLDEVTELQGELTPDLEVRMENVNHAITMKTDNVVQWVQSQEDLISLVDMKVKELADFKKGILAKLDRFDGYVDACLNRMNTNKIQGELYQISKRKPTKVVIIHDEKEIPMDFIKIPEPEPTIMKTEIAKALKSGQSVPGASLEDSKNVSITYTLKKGE
jgi:hypothetical protein